MPIIKVKEVHQFVQMVETRMPFRYGTAQLVRCPHLYVTATIEDTQGRVARGIAADNLPPLWFDKDPQKDFAQQIADQLRVVNFTVDDALEMKAATPFSLWLDVYESTQDRVAKAKLSPLLGGFGPSLLERAINDAVGNLLKKPFHAMLRDNDFGIEFGLADIMLNAVSLREVLPERPLDSIAARHTVGLSDPIRTAEIADDERLHDGLPQSLEEVIDFYGVRYFKIKVSNQLETDLTRLETIAALVDEKFSQTEYFCTLDGNEQYNNFEELQPLLAALNERKNLQRLAASIIFIEQPLARAAALDEENCRALNAVTHQFPVIIDESDGELGAFPRALELGYSGTSHKNCKNTFKSVINLARAQQQQAETGRPILLSAEDLTNIGSIALQQDLTALSTLGITHAERNGHHYFLGLTHLSTLEQGKVLQEYSELYCQDQNFARLDIQNGNINCAALHKTNGLGSSIWPDLEARTPVEEFEPFAAFA